MAKTNTVNGFYKHLRTQAESRFSAIHDHIKLRIQVGSATCEHAAGSREVYDEFEKHIRLSGRDDILLHRTGCTGRCSQEPIVGILVPGQMPLKFTDVDAQMVHDIFVTQTQNTLLDKPIESGTETSREEVLEFLFCDDRRCRWAGNGRPMSYFKKLIEKHEVDADKIHVVPSGCFGACSADPEDKFAHVLVRPGKLVYRIQVEEDLDEIVEKHVCRGEVVDHLVEPHQPVNQKFFEFYGDLAFFNRQTRLALRNNGVIDPTSIDEYIHYDGFKALHTVLAGGDPEDVVSTITQAKLRGRGGGGYPTGLKWSQIRASESNVRYIICNADEGDPGAFMDRSMLESDPFNVIEGMIIGGFATGAQQGFFYVRAEYPLAIARLESAIEKCREHGLLGKDIMSSGFDFDLEIRLGAGAFVCGEETALIKSIEGERGQPRIRPPFPTEKGLYGQPTVINNVETFANIATIINYGSEWFAHIGTEESGGTKVFALAGNVKHTGLVEVPLGTTLRQVVFDIGGGVEGDKAVKAIQTGGPAGGFIPVDQADLEVDFDTLNKAGSIMGSGGMIVLSEDDCMVDLARFYMSFSQDESCGKCTPCREGTTRMLEILERITAGKADASDLENLERLADLVHHTSLCGLGRAAPNPVLSTLKHFRSEYEAHVHEQCCPAKSCSALIHYEIDEALCTGCTVCAKRCPAECIEGVRRKPHAIRQQLCIKCGVCFDVCKFKAVSRL
ncbi:MAG: NADH-quinone oxidoreductase subunit NuoF [Myxococcota bacterium]|nr:NADH-quinone oxidoreductase subunit NuoF [Myxococcota bacterium]